MSKPYGHPKTGRWAIWLGSLVRDGKMIREENESRMDELMLWDKGVGPKPDWMRDPDNPPHAPMVLKP